MRVFIRLIMDRCINLDWLEVFAEEPQPLTPDYFQRLNYQVKIRDYGTPQYRQMFVVSRGIYSQGTAAVASFEIRRDPYSIKSQGGIFNPNAMHIRLSNSTCYTRDPVGLLLQFCARHRIRIVCTSRLDIALDFQIFENGTAPREFLSDYFRGRFAKVNQSKFSVHGVDTWNDKTYHSVKWGSDASRITTKMYCKTLELLVGGHDKPYIRSAWAAAGLDPLRDVWRIEFSMKSSCKSMVEVDTGNVVDLSIDNMRSRQDLMTTFAALYEHYFDFRRVTGQRKDRCPRIELMNFAVIDGVYKWLDIPQTKQAGKRELMMLRYLDEIIAERWDMQSTWAAQELREVFVKKFRFAKSNA